MNTIPQTGRWNEISSQLNDNFSLISNKIMQLYGVAYKFRGLYKYQSELPLEHNSQGDYALVDYTGSQFYIYRYDGGWINTNSTVFYSDVFISGEEIPSATTEQRGLMEPTQVNALNSLTTKVGNLVAQFNEIQEKLAQLDEVLNQAFLVKNE